MLCQPLLTLGPLPWPPAQCPSQLRSGAWPAAVHKHCWRDSTKLVQLRLTVRQSCCASACWVRFDSRVQRLRERHLN